MAPKTEQALVAALQDKSLEVDARAASLLGFRRLAALINDDHVEVRKPLVALLADSFVEFDHQQEFAELLLPLVANANADFRRLVIEALGNLARGTPLGPLGVVQAPAPERTWVVTQVVPAVAKGLKDTQPAIRAASASALGRIGAAAKSAVGPLTETLSDPEAEVRRHAAEALGNIGSHAQPAVRALAHTLGDVSSQVRVAAALALQTIGPKDDDVRAAVVEVISQPDKETRRAAVEALGTVGEGKDVAPTLLSALKDPEPLVRRAAAEALQQRGATVAEQAVPALLAALNDEEIDTYAANALVAIGGHSPLVVQELTKTMADSDFDLERKAVQILQQIDATPAAIALVRLVCETDRSDVTDDAVAILSEIGPPAKETVALIVDANVNRSEWENRVGIAEILRDIGPAVVPELVAALGDPHAHCRLMAIWVLGDYGPGAKDAVPALVKATHDLDKKCREAAFIALGRVGGDVDGRLTALLQSVSGRHGEDSAALDKLMEIGQSALPVLRQGLHDEKPAVRRGALTALGTFGINAPEVVPDVIPLLQDPDVYVRRDSVYLLHRYHGQAKQALPALRQLLRDEKNDGVRKAAEAAIKAIETNGF